MRKKEDGTNMIDDKFENLNFYDINVLNQIWEKGASYSYNERTRPYCGICFVVSGKIKYKCADKDIFALTGDVVILKKASSYKASFYDEKTNDILVNFQCEKSDIEKDFFDMFKNDVSVLKNRLDMKKSFFEIAKYDMLSGKKFMVKSELYKIMDEICNIESENTIAKNAKQIIDSDMNFLLKESELAKKCSVSISTLQRTFKKAYGKTVSEYKNELKTAKAKELLNQKNHSAEEIAEILGYCDSSHFSKAFKKHVGISPKKYSNQH